MSQALLQRRLAAVRARTASTLTAWWDQLPAHGRDQAEAFAARAVPVVTAGQLVAARTTGLYVARRARIAPVALPRAAVTGSGARRGVDPLEEYQRPFGVVWGALGDDVEPDEAVARGRARLALLAVTDVWLAMRAATAVIDQATPAITGWTRVADAGACELCAAADGTPYDAAADLAGHPNCGCTSEPVLGDAPPSEPADPDATDVEEHGELGPLLVPAGARLEEP
jgi:hypothetical protein